MGVFCCRAYTVLRATSSPPRTSHRDTENDFRPRPMSQRNTCLSTQWPPLINPKNDVATRLLLFATSDRNDWATKEIDKHLSRCDIGRGRKSFSVSRCDVRGGHDVTRTAV